MGTFGGLFRPNIEDLKEKRNISGLIQLLSHTEWNVRRDAALALGELGNEVSKILMSLKAMRGIASIMPDLVPGDCSIEFEEGVARSVLVALPPLTEALKDRESEVSKASMQAFAEIKNVERILAEHLAEQ